MSTPLNRAPENSFLHKSYPIVTDLDCRQLEERLSSKWPMSSAKQPTDSERDRNGGVRLMLNRIHDRALERNGSL
jgi:hypothetical protein